jgi:hypothetical protein
VILLGELLGSTITIRERQAAGSAEVNRLGRMAIDEMEQFRGAGPKSLAGI